MEASADRQRHLTAPLFWLRAVVVGAVFIIALLLVFSAKDAGASVLGGEPPVPLPGPVGGAVGGVVGTVDQTADQTLDQTVPGAPVAAPVIAPAAPAPAAPVPAAPFPVVPETLGTVTAPSDPVIQTAQPVRDAIQPVGPIAQPVLDAAGPVLGITQPILGVAGPVLGIAHPVLDAAGPVLTIPDHLTGTIVPLPIALVPAVVGVLPGLPPVLPPLPPPGTPTELLPLPMTPSPSGASIAPPPLASVLSVRDSASAPPPAGAPANQPTVRNATRALTPPPSATSDTPALPVPEPALPIGTSVPFSTTGSSSSFDLGSSLHVLLYALALAFSAIFGMRARRLLQFGAVTPRFAFVSLIERPG